MFASISGQNSTSLKGGRGKGKATIPALPYWHFFSYLEPCSYWKFLRRIWSDITLNDITFWCNRRCVSVAVGSSVWNSRQSSLTDESVDDFDMLMDLPSGAERFSSGGRSWSAWHLFQLSVHWLAKNPIRMCSLIGSGSSPMSFSVTTGSWNNNSLCDCLNVFFSGKCSKYGTFWQLSGKSLGNDQIQGSAG